MADTIQQGSAKIFQFPTKRDALIGRRRGPGDLGSPSPQPLPAIDFGSCWYHEAAVQEAERTPDR